MLIEIFCLWHILHTIVLNIGFKLLGKILCFWRILDKVVLHHRDMLLTSLSCEWTILLPIILCHWPHLITLIWSPRSMLLFKILTTNRPLWPLALFYSNILRTKVRLFRLKLLDLKCTNFNLLTQTIQFPLPVDYLDRWSPRCNVWSFLFNCTWSFWFCCTPRLSLILL